MVGNTLLHYQILEKLGEGGMGVVYKAEDTRLKRTVALKCLPRHLVSGYMERERLKVEARAAAALDHPNIATIHSIEEVDGALFIVMEYIAGKTIEDDLDAAPDHLLPLETTLDLAGQVIEGLQAAHAHGIVHRDIKPSNVIVTGRGQAKIVDFGLARIGEGVRLTKEHATLGTAAYMSPEQARGERVDHRTDIWSVGVMLYEMVTGQRPFRADYEAAVIYSILNGEPEPPAALRSGVPPSLDRIILKAMAKEPDDRYQHADEIITDLGTVEEGCTGKEQRRRPDIRWFASPLLWTGIILSLGLLIGLLTYLPRDSIAFQNRDWVLIADFENVTEHEVFSGALEEAMAREMSQSQYVNVVPPGRKFDVLRLMKKSPDTHLDVALAREVAVRDGGIRAVLSGNIRQIGDTFVITVQLIDPQNGTRVADLSEDARGINDVLAAIRRLSDSVRMNLGESLSKIAPPAATGKQAEWYEKVTTVNLQALQSYRRGYEFVNQFNWQDALLFERQAIQQDSTFAMAYVMAGFMYSNTGRNDQARPYLARALSLSDNLTDREKYFIKGSHAYVFGDYEKAIEQYTILVDLYPDDFWGQTNLFISYAWMQDFQRAFDHLEQAARIRPNHPGSLGMLLVYEMAVFEDLQTAQKYYQRIAQIAPDFDFAPFQIFKSIQLWADGNLQGTQEELQAALVRTRGFSSWTRWAIYMTLANFEVYRGHFQRAIHWIDTATDYGRENNITGVEASGICQKGLLFQELGNNESSESELQMLSTRFSEPLSSGGAVWLAYHLVQAGRATERTPILEKLKKSELDPREKQAFDHLIRGKWALVSNRAVEAIEHFHEARKLVTNARGHSPPYFYSPLLADLALAEAYEQNHQLDEAIKTRQEIIAHKIQHFYPGFVMGPFEWIKANYHLGRLYEQKGDLVNAVDYYRKFLLYWNSSDKMLPEIQDAKDRLARLSERIG